MSASLRLGLTLLACLATGPALALPLQPGSILVTNGQLVSEYSPSGEVLQQGIVPHPTQPFPLAGLRDLVVRPDGTVAFYHTTFDTRLTLWDPTTDTFEHHALAGWSSASCANCGGVAAKGSFVYATDMGTPRGIVRYDGATGLLLRFADTFEFTDVNLGLDGFLYALSDDETVVVFDPSTMDLLRTLSVSSLVKSIAVDADGTIYTGNLLGTISRLGPDGTELGTLQFSPNEGATDIDLDASGRIIAKTSSSLVITDTAFSSLQSFAVPGGFVSFATSVPEPATLSLAATALGLAAATRLRRRG